MYSPRRLFPFPKTTSSRPERSRQPRTIAEPLILAQPHCRQQSNLEDPFCDPFSSSTQFSPSSSTASSISGTSASSQCRDSLQSQSQSSLRLSLTEPEPPGYTTVECRPKGDDDDEGEVNNSQNPQHGNCQPDNDMREEVRGAGAGAGSGEHPFEPKLASNDATVPDAHLKYIENSYTRVPPSCPPSPRTISTLSKDRVNPGPTEMQTPGHRRHVSLYDGSDYGNDSDFEDSGDFTPGFETCIANIDKLCRWSITDQVIGGEEVITRVTDSLHQLNNGADQQGMVESCATRLITMHTSLSCHLNHQIRVFESVTGPFDRVYLSSLRPSVIDDISCDIDDLFIDFLHFAATPYTNADHSLSADPLQLLISFTSQTTDLVIDLHAISKSIQKFRHLSTLASHRLTSAREELGVVLGEQQRIKNGCKLIEEGDWDRKLEQREAGKMCQDIIDGFEKYYEELRTRLVGGHGMDIEDGG